MVAVTRPFNVSIAEAQDPKAWLTTLSKHYNEEEITRISEALAWAKASYHDQVLLPTLEPIFDHAIATAAIVVELRMDADTVCATLLFSLVDCIPDYLNAIIKKFGPSVALLAEGINKMREISLLAQPKNLKQHEAAQQIESMRKMLLAMVEDIRVVLVKLAWRTQTMHYLQNCTTHIQQKIAQESLDIFAPLANRLGIWQIKWELEDLSFRFLEPTFYKKIANLLDERRIDRERFINDVLTRLQFEMDTAGIHASLMGRPKHIYSIYKKMQKKQLDFSDLYDIRAVRILVDDIKTCYTALGIIHHIWQPIPGEFDDYIAHPKGNDYRSLHTAVIGPQDKAVEIQIRTFDMHEHAEYGVAAHWQYKEGGNHHGQFEAKIAWMRHLIDWREDIHQGKTLSDAFKTELFNDTIYVMTPEGKVITLPAGSTPIDFAYHVHTDLGHRCRGAKVNGSIVPLNTPLKNGQRIEILTAKEGGPSIDWLQQDYLKSARAISKVRQWIRQQNIDCAIDAGRAVFEREISRTGASTNIETITAHFHCKTAEDFFVALGQGDISVRDLNQVLHDIGLPTNAISPSAPTLATDIIHSAKADIHGKGILVEGVDKLMTMLAKCCKPVPPDVIIGFVTKGRGISIHCADCASLKKLAKDAPERIITANWGENINQVFSVDLRITAIQHPTLLRDLSEVLAREKINITAVNTSGRDHRTTLQFTIEIRDAGLLPGIIHRLQQVHGVNEIIRK